MLDKVDMKNITEGLIYLCGFLVIILYIIGSILYWSSLIIKRTFDSIKNIFKNDKDNK